MSNPTLFDFISDISERKRYLLSPDNESVYNIYMVNKAFAQHPDTIILAAEMNKRPSATKLMHHDFLFYSINASKRFGKWAKAEAYDKELVDYIKNKYCLSNKRALEYLELYDEKEIKEIKNKLKTLRGRQ